MYSTLGLPLIGIHKGGHRGSLKGIRARVERMAAEHERRQGSTRVAELVRVLQAARTQKPKENWDNWPDEQVRERRQDHSPIEAYLWRWQ